MQCYHMAGIFRGALYIIGKATHQASLHKQCRRQSGKALLYDSMHILYHRLLIIQYKIVTFLEIKS